MVSANRLTAFATPGGISLFLAARTASAPSATSLPECYTRPPGGNARTGTVGMVAPIGAPTAGVATAQRSFGGACNEFPGFAPAFYRTNDLPDIPVRRSV